MCFLGKRFSGSTDSCQRCVNCHWLGSDSWRKGTCILCIVVFFFKFLWLLSCLIYIYLVTVSLLLQIKGTFSRIRCMAQSSLDFQLPLWISSSQILLALNIFSLVIYFQLYNVVVDTEVTGKKLISNGKLKRRYTFIPLNKIASRTLSNDVVKRAEGLVSW